MFFLFRKMLVGMGALSLGMMIAIGIGIAFMFQQSNSLDSEARVYTDEAVTAITRHWDADELLKRAAPQLLHASKPEQVREFVEAASTRLGPLLETESAKGETKISSDVKHGGTTVTAGFVARAKFAHGEVEIDVALIKTDGRWLITGFHVRPTETVTTADARSI